MSMQFNRLKFNIQQREISIQNKKKGIVSEDFRAARLGIPECNPEPTWVLPNPKPIRSVNGVDKG